MSILLNVENYKVYYRTLSGYIRAVDGVYLSVDKGKIIGVVGESGSGKSTLALSLVLPKPPMVIKGRRVIFDNSIDMLNLNTNERRKLLFTRISIIPQYSLDALPVIKKIRKLITDLARDKNIDVEELLNLFKERLKTVNLPDRVLDMYPIELSGGMRQRVVIAISTLLKPDLLIADEPTSALDVVTQRQVLELLTDLRDQGIIRSLIFITHDIAAVRQIADKIATMYAGKIVEIGDLESTITSPLHPYTSLLIKSVPSLEVSYRTKTLRGLGGIPPSLLNPPEGCRFHPRCPYVKPTCTREEPPLVKVGSSYVACWLYSKR